MACRNLQKLPVRVLLATTTTISLQEHDSCRHRTTPWRIYFASLRSDRRCLKLTLEGDAARPQVVGCRWFRRSSFFFQRHFFTRFFIRNEVR